MVGGTQAQPDKRGETLALWLVRKQMDALIAGQEEATRSTRLSCTLCLQPTGGDSEGQGAGGQGVQQGTQARQARRQPSC